MAVKSAPIEQQILLFEGRIEIMDIYTSIFTINLHWIE
jgi:hypothetical protein